MSRIHEEWVQRRDASRGGGQRPGRHRPRDHRRGDDHGLRLPVLRARRRSRASSCSASAWRRRCSSTRSSSAPRWCRRSCTCWARRRGGSRAGWTACCRAWRGAEPPSALAEPAARARLGLSHARARRPRRSRAGGAGRRLRRRRGPARAGATLVLDFSPNAVHAGIYVAKAHGFDDGRGRGPARPRARRPRPTGSSCCWPSAPTSPSSTSTTSRSRASRAATRRDHAAGPAPAGRGAGPAQRRTPRALEGREVGVTGLPSRLPRSSIDRRAARAATPRGCAQVTIGFNAVQALLGGKVAGATAFWNVEGVALHAAAPEDARVPRGRVRRPRLPRARPLRDPHASSTSSPQLARATVARSCAATSRRWTTPRARSRTSSRPPPTSTAPRSRPSSTPSPRPSSATLRASAPCSRRCSTQWAQWEARFGIVRRPPDVARAFDAASCPKLVDQRVGCATATRSHPRASPGPGSAGGSTARPVRGVCTSAFALRPRPQRDRLGHRRGATSSGLGQAPSAGKPSGARRTRAARARRGRRAGLLEAQRLASSPRARTCSRCRRPRWRARPAPPRSRR